MILHSIPVIIEYYKKHRDSHAILVEKDGDGYMSISDVKEETITWGVKMQPDPEVQGYEVRYIFYSGNARFDEVKRNARNRQLTTSNVEKDTDGSPTSSSSSTYST